MKKLKYNILFLLLVVFSSYGFANEEEYVKKMHKEWDVNESTLLEIQNKFGDITVKNITENKVMMDIIITVKAKDQKDADKKTSFISINFPISDNHITAITEIDS
ncbi:MAG: hypothetical protein C0594_07315, partial [Marinilabiliales bacterium]